MTDEERMILKAAGKRIEDETNWWYEEVKKYRDKLTDKDIEKIEKIAEDRGGLLHLTDICNLIEWKKGRDTEKRNRLQQLSSRIMITKGDYGAYYIFQVLKRGLKEDVVDATDFFLTKKEGKAVRRRRKREAKTGEIRKREIKGVMSEDEKKAARKERAKIRREAKKLGITTEEYKERMNTEEMAKKVKPEKNDDSGIPSVPDEVVEKAKPKRKKKKEASTETKTEKVSRKPPGANRKRKRKTKRTAA